MRESTEALSLFNISPARAQTRTESPGHCILQPNLHRICGFARVVSLFVVGSCKEKTNGQHCILQPLHRVFRSQSEPGSQPDPQTGPRRLTLVSVSIMAHGNMCVARVSLASTSPATWPPSTRTPHATRPSQAIAHCKAQRGRRKPALNRVIMLLFHTSQCAHASTRHLRRCWQPEGVQSLHTPILPTLLWQARRDLPGVRHRDERNIVCPTAAVAGATTPGAVRRQGRRGLLPETNGDL